MMRRRFWLLLALVLGPVLLTAIRLSPAFVQDEWTALFDGETFEGWEGNLDVFRIEDSTIVAGTMAAPIPRNEFLCTTRTYDDFELRLKFKLLGEGANAGIQIRSRRIPDDHEVIGYQADMGEGWWGALYDESRRREILAQPSDPEALARVLRPEEWNSYTIRAEGRRIQLAINGVQTVDYTEPLDTLEQSGHICVQIHSGPPSEAWYRDIALRALPVR